MSKKILVTGGAGYVGSHACKALKQAGYEPITFDNLKRGHKEFVKFGPLIHGDLLNRNQIKAAFEAHQIESVMHFAALAQVGESVQEPERYYENNVLGTLNLLHSMREKKINRFIFSSTCATYGIPTTVPIPDSHPQNPISPYGETKLLVEKMLRDFHTAYGLRSVSLRYFNAAGADPDAEIGECHQPETHLIPILLDVAIEKRKSFKIFGQDYNTKDGTCIRDYIHVCDLADAHLKSLQWLESQNACEGLNLSTNQGYSVKEVRASAERITNRRIPFEISERRPGDPDSLVGLSNRAQDLLKWKPKSSSIDQIIESAWKWHQKKDSIVKPSR